MAVAMIGALLITYILAPFAGPFELMFPAMVISMTVGMCPVNMLGMGDVSFSTAALFGLAAGGAVQGAFHAYDLSLHGEVNA